MSSGIVLVYVHEPTRGISAGRNAAIASARDWQADAICFIDDDEGLNPTGCSSWSRPLAAPVPTS